MTEYRAIRPQEWPEALALWEKVFNVGSWLFQSLHESSPRRSWDHTRVAVVDGKIVSAVDLFIRHMRDENGDPCWVGGIGSVATLEEYRKQGHSRELLRQTIHQMEVEALDWSFLFTGTHHHYAALGWETTELSASKGRLALIKGLELGNARKLTGPEWPHPQFARLFDSFNAKRPLTHIRSEQMWSIAVDVRLGRPDKSVFATYLGDVCTGYLVASSNDEEGFIEELCADSEMEARSLLQTLALEFQPKELESVEWQLPEDPMLDGLRNEFLSEVQPFARPWSMSRPVSPKFPLSRIRQIIATPGAVHYSLDNF